MANEREPNNSRAAADQLTENQYTYGNLSNSSDDDFFKLSLNSAGRIEIDFLSPLSGEGFFQDFWYIRVYDNLGNTLNIDQKVSSGSFYTYVDKPGNYFIRIYQNDSFDLDTSEYGIKYSFTPGNYAVGFENNNSSTNASPIVIGSPIYGNLYNQFDDDWYTFNLPFYDDTIKVTYDLPPYSGTFFVDNFEIYLYDSAGNVLDGGEFADDGSFTVSTKSKGKFYILVDQDYGPDVSRNLYNLTVETSSSSGSGSSSSSTSSSSGSGSSSSSTSSSNTFGASFTNSNRSLTSTNINDISADDIFNSNQARSKDFWLTSNGDLGKGYQLNPDSFMSYELDSILETGTPEAHVSFIIKVEYLSDGGVTRIDNVSETLIKGFNPQKDTLIFQSFNDPDFNRFFSKDNLLNASRVDVISDSINNFTRIYFSPDSNGTSDTLTLDGITDGDLSSINIVFENLLSSTSSTISTGSSYAAEPSSLITYKISTEGYSGRYNPEVNDVYSYAEPLDPNWDSDNTFTSSHYSNTNIMKANLSNNGDYDRFWVYLDDDERIIFEFDPPDNSSYEILFVNEATGEIVKEEARNTDIVSIDSSPNTSYLLYYTVPSYKVYHIVIRAKDGGLFSSDDYTIKIRDIENPTTLSASSFNGLNQPDAGNEINGSSIGETLNGTAKGENINGLSGNDTIYGSGGADVIKGGAGSDLIYGGSGRDDIYVEKDGKDVIFGGDGIDILTVPDNTWKIIRAVDVNGDIFKKNQEYLYVSSEDGESITVAAEIEKISIYKKDSNGNQVWGNTDEEDSTYSLNEFDYTPSFWWIVKTKLVKDFNVPYKGFSTIDASNVNIDLDNYFAARNYGHNVQYSIVSPESSDYLSINNNILTINARENFYETVTVTISARNLKPDGSIINGDNPTTESFNITFAPDLIGDEKNNTINGTSLNDVYNVTDGVDFIDAGEGTDTIVIPFDPDANSYGISILEYGGVNEGDYNYTDHYSNYLISKLIDIDGTVTGKIDQEYLYILKFTNGALSGDTFGEAIEKGNNFLDDNFTSVSNGESYVNVTIATNFEKIFFENKLYNYDDFISTSYWMLNQGNPLISNKISTALGPKQISDKTLLNSKTETVNLDDYYSNQNAGMDINYTLVSVDNEKISDQVSLDDSLLILKSGSTGPTETAIITVKGSLKYDPSKTVLSEQYWKYENEGIVGDGMYDDIQSIRTLTFKVSMSDDDADPQTYSLDSSSTNVEEGVIISFTLKSSSNVSEDINLTWEVASAKNFNSLDETSDNDINPVSGTITILSGSSSSSFEVKINSDNLLENDESFKINILDSNSEIIASDIIIVRDVNNLGYELSVEKNENGPDLKEFSDTYNNRGTLNHTVNNEIIVLTGQAGTIRGLRGDDVYLVSNLITSNAKIQITDTDGNNTIEIPDNTLITKALFASNAAKLTLGKNQEITITSADKFSYNVSGNVSNGDIGKSLTYAEFANIFGIELSNETQEVEKNYYMKSDAVSESSFNIINISGTDDATIFATNDADEFRYEVNNDGTSAEGPYSFEIEGFDKTNDKLVLVNKNGNNILTTQELDAKDNVEVTSDGIVGTQILFAPDSSGQSGKLTIKEINEQFSNNWTAETYSVEIKPVSQLTSSDSLSETSYTFSDTPNLSKPVISEFNSSTSNGVLNYSDQNDIIILNGSGKTAAGKSGDDLYIISDLIPKNGKIQITDTIGSNIIQIPDNTYIDDTLFTKNATRLTLKDGREVTISNADEFTYNLGANITAGDEGLDLSYQEFASAFGVEDVLSLSSSVNGTIVDQYII